MSNVKKVFEEALDACGRGEWAAALGAAKEVARVTVDGYDHDLGLDFGDDIQRAAGLAIDADRVDVAQHLFSMVPQELGGGALSALVAGDLELFLVHLCAGAPFQPGGHLLWRALGVRGARALDAGDPEHRLLGLHAVAASFGMIAIDEDPSTSLAEFEAWANARRLPTEPAIRIEAVIRMCRRRREGPGGHLFESCAADLGSYTGIAPELFDEAAQCARRCLDRGSKSPHHFETFALHAVAHGNEDEARARLANLLAASTRSPGRRARLERAWERVEALRDRPVEAPVLYAISDVLLEMHGKVLGTFEVESGGLVISDPCYEYGSKLQARVWRAGRGTWRAVKYRVDEREAFLVARHGEGPPGLEGPAWEVARTALGDVIAVDSGQVGIFDAARYRDPAVGGEAWYKRCCAAHATGGGIEGGWVVLLEAGDGMYRAWVARKRGEIVAVCVCIRERPGR